MDEEMRDKMNVFILKSIIALSDDLMCRKEMERCSIPIDTVKDMNSDARIFLNQLERW